MRLMESEFIDRIRSMADDIFPAVVAARRHLHANPELSFQEYATAEFVAKWLRDLDVAVEEGVGGAGVVGRLGGAFRGRTVALRADMDALPIQEETGLAFSSTAPGKMHACGHDAHMASLLGAAAILSRTREDVSGAFTFIFQPGEEKVPGGAKRMIGERVLEESEHSGPADLVLGLHVRPDIPTGTVGVRGGAFMASTDEIHITVHGTGGHAAEPHRLDSDPVYVAAQIVVALQAVISRHCPPDVASVLTFGEMTAAGTTNVIPGSARLAGTFRSMNEAWRVRAHGLVHRIVEHTAAAHGARADCRIDIGYPVLQNHEMLARTVSAKAAEYLGSTHVLEPHPWMAGEDFTYFARERPACFFLLGAGGATTESANGLHTSRFTVDEEALRVGSGLLAYLAWSLGRTE
jgi:hippurate hydrolase